jgi:hypothetical protein
MQTPPTAPPNRKDCPDWTLYGGSLSLVRFCASIALLLITIAIWFATNGSDDSAVRTVSSSSEFSSGMPLP